MSLKLKKTISYAINIILIGVLLLLGSVFIASKVLGSPPEVLGYQLKVVLSGSMEPAFQTGSMIAIKSGGDMTRFNETDVITFANRDQKVVTHRVIEKIHQEDNVLYRTKGDHNEAPDGYLVASENILGEWNGFTIPYVGYLFLFANSTMGIITLLIIPGVLLLLYSLFTIRGLKNKLNNDAGKASPSTQGVHE